MNNQQYTDPGFCLPSFESTLDLVYSRQNCDVRETERKRNAMPLIISYSYYEGDERYCW